MRWIHWYHVHQIMVKICSGSSMPKLQVLKRWRRILQVLLTKILNRENIFQTLGQEFISNYWSRDFFKIRCCDWFKLSNESLNSLKLGQEFNKLLVESLLFIFFTCLSTCTLPFFPLHAQKMVSQLHVFTSIWTI